MWSRLRTILTLCSAVTLTSGSMAYAQPQPPAATATMGTPPVVEQPQAETVIDQRFRALPVLTWRSINTRETVQSRVYLADGSVDPECIRALGHLFRDTRNNTPSPIVVRTIQLIVRAATHFGAREIEVISGYRTGLSASGQRIRREGYHGVGSAVDFRLVSVSSAELAAYARTFSHVGVGHYPRMNFVHLDSREQSFTWENSARSNHHGWNRPLARGELAERDRTWTHADDLPWDRPGERVTLDLHPRTAAGAHRPHSHARRHARRHAGRHGDSRRRSRHTRRTRHALHVFAGASTQN
ncbi:MAG: DUF882 domain-containing protein [Deltaproteobacteria bacterium]|nr:DUF882 domain-containing protein [Deltaproteobacteria bacterium]